MQQWSGSAGVCVNENAELLMILQGKPKEKKKWSIPSGGRENGETFEECCIREVEEETGYIVEVVEKIKVKRTRYETWNTGVEVHYFLVQIVGGSRNFQDPDQLIYDIAWKAINEIKTINLSFPEDREFLIDYITKNFAKT
ncbi:NUDIX hydrolase [Virgibacillus kimchii]